MKCSMKMRGRMALQCFVCALAVGVGMLLSPTAARGQSSVSPTWVQLAWANDSGFSVRPLAIEVHEDKLYVTGHAEFFGSGATFGGTHLGSEGSYAFLASYDTGGRQLWVETGGFEVPEAAFATALQGFSLVVNDTAIYTSEGYRYIFDSGMLTSGGVSINQYAIDGTHRWFTPIHPVVSDPASQPGFTQGFGADDSGNLYVAGVYRDTLILAPDTLAAFPLEAPEYVGDVFLASYTPEGVLRWSRRIGGPRHEVIADWRDSHGAFAVDREGNTYLGGFFSQGATFGEEQPTEVMLTRDAYALASYDQRGALRWVRTERDLGISDNAGPWRLAVDVEDNLFVDWFILSTVSASSATVGDSTFYDPGFGGEFFTKIAPDGTLLWVRQIESDGNEIVAGVAVDARGHSYVAGMFDGNYVRVGDQVVNKADLQADEHDGFVAHFDRDGNIRWLGQAAGRGSQRIIAVTASPSGDLYVAGEFEETMRLGSVTFDAQNASGFDMFVAKYAAASITSSEDYGAVSELPAGVQAFPNPFRDRAILRYGVPSPGHVRLVVSDLIGREVAVLVDERQTAGIHEAVLEGSHLPSGHYLYRLDAGGQILSGTVLLLK